MNKAYRLLLIHAVFIILIAVLSYLVFGWMQWQFTALFIVLPVFFLMMTGVMYFLVKYYSKKQDPIGVGAILGVRMALLLPCIAMFVAGIYINRSQIVGFTVMFALYYVVFAFAETKILMKLTKKGN